MSTSDEDKDNALIWLAQTDAEEATLYANSLRAKERKESVFALCKAASDGTVADKEAFAHGNDEYRQSAEEYFTAVADHRKLKNQRDRAEITIDVWRSENSRLKKANVI